MESRIIFREPGVVEVEPYDPRPLRDGEVRIRTLYSLMSTGTELTALDRRFDDDTHWERYVRYPFRPGYCLVGRVEEGDSDLQHQPDGSVVFAMAGHASLHALAATSVVSVPAAVDHRLAAWCGLARIAFVGVRRGEVGPGDRVAVVGAGPIGQMALRWSLAAGAEAVAVIDPIRSRLGHAAGGGATHLIESPADQTSLRDTMGSLADVVIDATGQPDVFSSCLSLAAFAGRVVVLGDTGYPAQQRLSPDVITRGLTIVGAHGAHLGFVMGGPGANPFDPDPEPDAAAVARANGRAAQRVSSLFFRLAAGGRFLLDGLNTHTFAPAEAAAAYNLARLHRDETMGILSTGLAPSRGVQLDDISVIVQTQEEFPVIVRCLCSVEARSDAGGLHHLNLLNHPVV